MESKNIELIETESRLVVARERLGSIKGHKLAFIRGIGPGI